MLVGCGPLEIFNLFVVEINVAKLLLKSVCARIGSRNKQKTENTIYLRRLRLRNDSNNLINALLGNVFGKFFILVALQWICYLSAALSEHEQNEIKIIEVIKYS